MGICQPTITWNCSEKGQLVAMIALTQTIPKVSPKGSKKLTASVQNHLISNMS